MSRISATNDLAFKKVLASVENTDILGGLINDFFGIVAENIVIENPYSIEVYREYLNGEEVSVLRHTAKDVAATFETADFVSEMQVRKTRHFDKRALYYPFNRYCQNYDRMGAMELGTDGKPSRYSSLRPVYALNFLGEPHYADDDALRIFELYDPKRNKSYSKVGKELIRVGFFEYTKPTIETENQRHWRDYFLNGTVAPNAPDYIKKAGRIIEFVNLSEEERKVSTLLERAQHERDHELSGAYHDGRDEGKAEGITIRNIEIAKTMLQEGEPLDKVARYTGLTLDQIKSLI